jgi:hypothetical protein
MLRKMDDRGRESIANSVGVVVKAPWIQDRSTIDNRMQRGSCNSNNQLVSAGQDNPFQPHDINSILTAASKANKLRSLPASDIIVVGLSAALKSVTLAWLWQPHN